jgi:hypothetical protein
MSCKTGKAGTTSGKGDARRDNIQAFTEGMKHIKQPDAEWLPRGTIFLKKQNRTVIKYP